MPLTLTWKGATSLPVEAEILRPDTLVNLPASEIAHLPLRLGNTSAPVGDLFSVEGRLGHLHDLFSVSGDMPNVARLCEGMTDGSVVVSGQFGSHFAAAMSGGSAIVNGSVGPYAGAEMLDGFLTIHGDAGDHLGSALPGSLLGMRDGRILVSGSAGADVGLAMRRGLIAVAGSVGPGAGRGLIAGSVFIGGPAGIGLGSGLKRGTLVLLNGSEDAILPTFAPSGFDRPPFLSIYLRDLELSFPRWPALESARSALWNRFNGDLACGGQGEIWTRAQT